MTNFKRIAVICSVILLCIAVTAVFAQEEIPAVESEVVEEQPQEHSMSCYFTVTGVPGTYRERWYGSPTPSGVITGEYIVSPEHLWMISNLSNGDHAHVGTLTSYTSVDVDFSVAPPTRPDPDSAGYYIRDYAATATFYGYLDCSY